MSRRKDTTVGALADRHEGWLNEILPAHDRLRTVVSSLVESSLRERGIEFLSVSGRAKDLSSALEKIGRKSYKQPQKQLTDLSGVRVITYFESQARLVADVIRELFDIDEKNSLDRSSILGSDRIGYRSAHFVCSLGRRRRSLPEYRDISSLKFEVQIRTVLQHAWAELAHDRSYKFGPGLPTEIQRRLNLHSGLLEIADSAFDHIADEIQRYTASVERLPETKLASSEITKATLERFVRQLSSREDLSIDHLKLPDDVFDELTRFGLASIGDLERLATPDFLSDFKSSYQSNTNLGLIRDLMMYHDIDRYFRGKVNWGAIDESGFKFLAKRHGEDKTLSILQSRLIFIQDNEANFPEDEDD
ncbi:GTP pyrophosphokinase [Enterovirga sp. CN4-39]|uniref:GTP pyrophosphokinase n=1 Tax=Enterovirga sp. CN4-39 TaxID=3400910 RepID=UPI003C053167